MNTLHKSFTWDQVARDCRHRDYAVIPFACILKCELEDNDKILPCSPDDCPGLWSKGKELDNENNA